MGIFFTEMGRLCDCVATLNIKIVSHPGNFFNAY